MTTSTTSHQAARTTSAQPGRCIPKKTHDQPIPSSNCRTHQASATRARPRLVSQTIHAATAIITYAKAHTKAMTRAGGLQDGCRIDWYHSPPVNCPPTAAAIIASSRNSDREVSLCMVKPFYALIQPCYRIVTLSTTLRQRQAFSALFIRPATLVSSMEVIAKNNFNYRQNRTMLVCSQFPFLKKTGGRNHVTERQQD